MSIWRVGVLAAACGCWRSPVPAEAAPAAASPRAWAPPFRDGTYQTWLLNDERGRRQLAVMRLTLAGGVATARLEGRDVPTTTEPTLIDHIAAKRFEMTGTAVWTDDHVAITLSSTDPERPKFELACQPSHVAVAPADASLVVPPKSTCRYASAWSKPVRHVWVLRCTSPDEIITDFAPDAGVELVTRMYECDRETRFERLVEPNVLAPL